MGPDGVLVRDGWHGCTALPLGLFALRPLILFSWIRCLLVCWLLPANKIRLDDVTIAPMNTYARSGEEGGAVWSSQGRPKPASALCHAIKGQMSPASSWRG